MRALEREMATMPEGPEKDSLMAQLAVKKEEVGPHDGLRQTDMDRSSDSLISFCPASLYPLLSPLGGVDR